ncbi:MAG: hypothetical protein AAF711_01600 [Planctomycetota bacterium]
MYRLTCPSCQSVTESHFVRSGAIVRCAACDTKYRIKSAHFEREIKTGPRTLDETDTVLRSDSVDIDPDEAAPVSIDDEGNVVGLSGLSELMRWSDTQDSSQVTGVPQSEKSKRKAKSDAGLELPAAKPAKKKKSKAEKKPAAVASQPGTGRARAQALKRKKQKNTMISVGSAIGGIAVIAVVVVLFLPRKNETAETPSDSGTAGTDLVDNDAPGPVNNPKPDDTTTPDAEKPDEVLVFSENYQPSPNPEIAFVAPWVEPDRSRPPTDVPTVLTPVTRLVHEDWYVMTPPRGAADASGTNNVDFGQVTASALDDRTTLLVGSVKNNTERTVEQGELHIMLLDSTGNVFAETYNPLAMVQPGAGQPIALTIPTRYWQRSRGVRAGVQVAAWSDPAEPLQGIALEPAGQGDTAALRVSVKHEGERPLRSVIMILTATDPNGNAVGNYLVKENNLYVAKDQWLDLVVATPLPQGRQVAGWSAIVVPE